MQGRNLLNVTGLALLFAMCGAAYASEDPTSFGQLPQVEVVESSDDGVILQFDLSELSFEEAMVGGESFHRISIPGGGISGEVGHPGIPTFSRFVAIPDEGGCQVQAFVEEEEILEDIHLMPVQKQQEDWAYDPSAYARDGFGAEPFAEIGDPALFRDLRVVALTFQPVQYNPAQRSLRVIRRMRVEVDFGGTNNTNIKSGRSRAIPPSFARLYENMVVNYHAPPRDEMRTGTYLVICPDDDTVIDLLAPLLEWRTRSGSPAILATTSETGTNNSSIKTYIQAIYDTSQETPLEYVVLVGDAVNPYRIPTWTETLSGCYGEGDNPYTLLEGDDVLSDVHIGRLSFNSINELELIINKILGYETDPYMDDQSWFKRACLVGDPNDSGQTTVHVMQWVKRGLLYLGYTEIDTIWAEPFVSEMTTALNQGDSIFGYRGYWHMSGWTNAHTYALQNGWKLPFAVAITCDTGSFEDGTSISEGFLRAGTAPASPKGGIAGIGTSTICTETRYNNCIFYGIFQGLMYEGQHEIGAALTRGKVEMYLNYMLSQPNMVEIESHWNNLMGDPALRCWTDIPGSFTVLHPSTIPFGSNAVTVTVLEGVLPADGAQVCVWKGSETYSVGFTDSQGQIELPISTHMIGDMLVTVTKHNRRPYMSTIPVEAVPVYVGYTSSTIDDDNLGTSSGNGDGLVNPGETIELAVQLRNYGSNPASDVTAVLTTSDPLVTILDGEEDFGDIFAGGTAWSGDDFDFALDPSCQHGHSIRFGLDISSGVDEWHSIIDIEVTSADLVAESTTLYNAGPNGILDPGETVELSVELRNNGEASAQSVMGTLNTLSSYVTIIDGTGSFGSISPGGTGENTSDRFVVSADEYTYEGYLASFTLVTDFSNGLRDTTHFELTVGTRSSDDPVGPDRYGYLAYDDTDVSYGEAPVYEWIELDPAYGGDGEEIVLGDYGLYQDKSTVVDLPFIFTFYGDDYTKATVCSNGWVAMGSTHLVNFRNWTIPGVGGPDAMVAVFWDNLYQSGGAKAFQKYDEENHRWIVEWSRFRNDWNGATETFEAIFLDPAHHVTGSGDGEIIFQYHTIANVDTRNGYATVGIESPHSEDGLLYTYWNQYSAGGATLQAGRAIRIVPVVEGPLGTLRGTVTNASAGESPIPGAHVSLLNGNRAWTTDPNGDYGGLAPVGTYDVAVDHISFLPDTAFGVVIEEDQETVVDFFLVDILGPIIETTPHPSTTDTLGPYPVPITLVEYTGLDEALLYYMTNGGPFTPLPVNPIGGDDYLAEIPGQSHVTYVQYYVYARDVIGNESVDPPNAPADLYSFYVAPTVTLFTDDMEQDLGWTVGAPGDDATTGIWVRADPNGTWYNGELVQPEDDHTPDPGVMCFVTGNSGVDQGDDDVDDGRTTLTSPTLNLTSIGSVTLRYYRWYTNETGNEPNQDIWEVSISSNNGDTWVTLESTNESDRSWRLMEFDVQDYITPTDQVQIRFVASDEGGGSIVEAAVDDLEIILTGVTDVPEETWGTPVFALFQSQPNPAAWSTTIRFALDRAGEAKLSVYDVQGRLIRSLIRGQQGPGAHVVVWDTRDGRGHPVPSGIYFYKLEGESGVITKKLMLLK